MWRDPSPSISPTEIDRAFSLQSTKGSETYLITQVDTDEAEAAARAALKVRRSSGGIDISSPLIAAQQLLAAKLSVFFLFALNRRGDSLAWGRVRLPLIRRSSAAPAWGGSPWSDRHVAACPVLSPISHRTEHLEESARMLSALPSSRLLTTESPDTLRFRCADWPRVTRGFFI